MWVYDTETLAFLEVNEAAVRHYGYTREEFLSKRVLDIRPVEEIPRLLAKMATIRDGHQGEWRHRLKDGRLDRRRGQLRTNSRSRGAGRRSSPSRT